MTIRSLRSATCELSKQVVLVGKQLIEINKVIVGLESTLFQNKKDSTKSVTRKKVVTKNIVKKKVSKKTAKKKLAKKKIAKKKTAKKKVKI